MVDARTWGWTCFVFLYDREKTEKSEDNAGAITVVLQKEGV